MKVPRENIKSTGLSVVYDPDSRTDVNLDIILVHGLGGHPVKTWLHTPASEVSTGKDFAPTNIASATNLTSSDNEPVRALSLKHLASPNLKKGNTLKKPRNGEGPPPRLRVFGSPLRPRSEDFSDGGTGGGGLTDTSTAVTTRSGRAPRRVGSRRHPRAPAAAAARQQSPLKQSEPALDRWAAGDERDADEACDLGTFWPTDLLPDLCCDARILTWGFRTRIADGHLVPGQLDVFSRGRELLSDVNDLLASYREHGQSRELVFVAHSTGGIIIKEMLRLASSYEDTQNRPLLASIAGLVFIGCPMRDSPSGNMVEAMISMAAAAIGVEMNDRVLQELIGWDTSIAYQGRDALEQARHEYGFQVKTYRETIIIPPADDTYFPWVALALRRDSQSLEGEREEAEYIESDHLNMCRFASAGNDGYRSLASFILKLAHHQLLRKHRLTPEEEASLQLLAAPGSTNSQPAQFPTSATVLPEMPTRKAPPWLLKHSAFRSWYHRKRPQDRHRLLWLRGPAACGKSELLHSLISHITTEWSPTTHSSATITALVEGEPLLESIIQKSDSADSRRTRHKKCDKEKQQQRAITSIIKSPDHISTTNNRSNYGGTTTPTTTTRSGPTHETASPLRAILQQLWAHDPRLRNLVGGLAKASSLRRRDADSCGGQRRTQSDAGAQAPQPQTPAKVYSRRPGSGPGDDDGINNNHQAQGPPVHNNAGGKSRLVRGDRNNDRAGDVAAADEDHLHHQRSSGLRQEEAEGDAALSHLDDARIVSFFLEDYLRLKLPQTRAQASSRSEKQSRAARGAKPKAEEEEGGKRRKQATNSEVVIETPGTRRIFVFVDIAPTVAPSTARDILWCLAQLARRSTLSICVTSRGPEDGIFLPPGNMAIKHSDGYGDELRFGGPRATTTTAATAAAAAAVQQWEDGNHDGDDDGGGTMLTVDVPTSNAEDVAAYIQAALLPDIEDRDALAAKLASRSRGVMFWLEHAVAIVNDASEDGVSGEVVCSMLDDIAPEVSNLNNGPSETTASRSRSGSLSSSMMMMAGAAHAGAAAAAAAKDTGQARLDDLYAWKLRRLSVGEARAALVLMQWVMLAPEALRLNELLVAIRLTMLVWPQSGIGGGDATAPETGTGNTAAASLIARALDVEPPMSLRDLRRRPAGGAEYVPADNPSQFWRWARRISQGLVRLDGEARATTTAGNSKVSSEPLGLQRVVPAHESVRRFFLEGRGFQILTPSPSLSSPSPPPASEPNQTKQPQQQQQQPPTTDQLIDTSYYALLHTCLAYLNMTDFDSLSRTSTAGTGSNTASQSHLRTASEVIAQGPPSEAEEESTRLHRSNAEAQRALVTSSYPLLRYTVDNLVFHLLRPRALRYFPPQAALLRLLTADGCRVWRRWTRLLGIPADTGSGGGGIGSGTGAVSSTTDVPTAVLDLARSRPAAALLLRPVYGASFRLERVLRRAHKTAREQAAAAVAARARARARSLKLRPQRSARSVRSAGDSNSNNINKAVLPPTPRTPSRPAMVRSASEQSVVFALMPGGVDGEGGDDPKAHWLVPKSPRSPRLRSDSLGSIGSSPMSNPASPGVLVGIQEV